MALSRSIGLYRWRVLLFLTGLLALFFAERSLVGQTRVIALSYAVLAILFSLTLLFRVFQKNKDDRGVYRLILFEYGLILISIGSFGLANYVLSKGALNNSVQILWPALGALGFIPLCAKEWVLGQMLSAPFLDAGKIRAVGQSARIVVLGFVVFAGVNVMAMRWHKNVDLSYFKTTQVGEATKTLISGVDKKINIYVFYPEKNEVAQQLMNYMNNLSAVNSLVQVKRVDQSIDQSLARSFKIRSNGSLVFSQGAKFETLQVGLKMMSSRRSLQQLDGKVNMHLLKLLKPSRKAYFTTGHLERDFAPRRDDARLGYRDLKKLLETKNIASQRLGLGDGLAAGVPDDASMVIVGGATENFLEDEQVALGRYLQRGGRMMVLLDTQGLKENQFLLDAAGIKALDGMAATERYSVRVIGRDESPYNMATTRFNAHPSVMSLSRAAGRLGLVVLGATPLESLPTSKDDGNQIKFPVKTMNDGWIDKNSNGVFDEASEKRQSLNLVAAVENRKRHRQDSPQEYMRVLVVGDADVAGDGLMRNPGNAYFMMDALNWLLEEKDEKGTIENEEDIALVHRRDEDVIWFYGTSLVVPGMILFSGMFWSRRRQRKKTNA